MKKILALGSNLSTEWGKPAETLSEAIFALSERLCAPPECSRFFSTPAFPAGAGPDFVNAVITTDSDLTPRNLLEICHKVEQDALRKRDKRWGARTLDIDLIAYDDVILPDVAVQTHWRELPLAQQMVQTPQDLILPHPRVQDRAFVLVPMMDVAPNWRHPVLGLTTAQMVDRLPIADKNAVIPLET